jgi:hypothetical protein
MIRARPMTSPLSAAHFDVVHSRVSEPLGNFTSSDWSSQTAKLGLALSASVASVLTATCAFRSTTSTSRCKRPHRREVSGSSRRLPS